MRKWAPFVEVFTSNDIKNEYSTPNIKNQYFNLEAIILKNMLAHKIFKHSNPQFWKHLSFNQRLFR